MGANAKLIRNENVHTREHVTSWRMDKNKFWLGGRLFNTASRHVRNARPQGKARPQRSKSRHVHKRKCKARPQLKRKARPHVRKWGAPTQRKARPQDGRPNAKRIRNENVHTREH
jgi:hypothetical protein